MLAIYTEHHERYSGQLQGYNSKYKNYHKWGKVRWGKLPRFSRFVRVLQIFSCEDLAIVK